MSPAGNSSTCAVVATYNRKETLVSGLEVLVSLSALDAIVVVDGFSSDGTGRHLSKEGFTDQAPPEDGEGHWETTQNVQGTALTYMRFFEDFGGAGSFYYGMQRAYRDGHDYVWLMDDDVRPTEEALTTLLSKAEQLEVDGVSLGYVCSKVLYTDDSVHRMNVPEIQSKYGHAAFNSHDDRAVFRIRSCSFVSALFTRQAIEDCGLPLREFFIYNDDVEYTRRLSDAGWAGFYVPDSVVYHETADNTGVDVFTDESAMKHYYSTRNSLYLQKTERIPKYLLVLAYVLFARTVAILLRRQDRRFEFALVNLRGALASLPFDPTARYP